MLHAFGKAARPTRSAGRYRNAPTVSRSLHTIATWSCAPPRVPTPRSPGKGPNGAPISTAPQYSARASGVPTWSRQSLRSSSRFASATAITSIVTKALDDESPAERGSVLVERTFTPALSGAKSRESRRATAAM